MSQLNPLISIRPVFRGAYSTSDGGYVYCGSGMGNEVPSNSGSYASIYFKAWVEKLDANRNTVWYKVFNPLEYLSQFNVVKESANGNLLLFGNKRVMVGEEPTFTEKHTKGWFLTLSANGDSLKERTYSGINTSEDLNYVNDVKPTADGSFIMAGESIDLSPTRQAPLGRGWLVKVDSNGCVSANDPQCRALSVPSVPAVNETRVYPNPVSGQLNIMYQNNTATGSTFRLTDITGKVLITQMLSGKSGAETVDMSRLAAGIYLYQIVEGNAITKQGKVIKQ